MSNPGALRDKYSGHHAYYWADGSPCLAEDLSLRSVNFGQPWVTAGLPECRYGVAPPIAYVREASERLYTEYARDRRPLPDPDPEPLELILREMQWPNLDDVWADPDAVTMFLIHFARDILKPWLGEGPPELEPGFVINTVDYAEVEKKVVQFSGRARLGDVIVPFEDI